MSKFIGTWTVWWMGPKLVAQSTMQIPPKDWNFPQDGDYAGHISSSPTSGSDWVIDGHLSQVTASQGVVQGVVFEIWTGTCDPLGIGTTSGSFTLILNQNSPDTFGGYFTHESTGKSYPWLGVRNS